MHLSKKASKIYPKIAFYTKSDLPSSYNRREKNIYQ